MPAHNKALHRVAIPLRSISTGELGRYTRKLGVLGTKTKSICCYKVCFSILFKYACSLSIHAEGYLICLQLNMQKEL